MQQTSFEEVRRIAEKGDYKLIPIKREILSDIRTPVETLKALQNVRKSLFCKSEKVLLSVATE